MAGKSYLVVFEEMVELFSNNKSPIIPARKCFYKINVNKSNLYFVGEDASEKFRGTWWQIKIPYKQGESAEFQYVADSLRDALRLKPELDTSHWSCSTESAHEFVSGTHDWSEEPEEMELLVLD